MRLSKQGQLAGEIVTSLSLASASGLEKLPLLRILRVRVAAKSMGSLSPSNTSVEVSIGKPVNRSIPKLGAIAANIVPNINDGIRDSREKRPREHGMREKCQMRIVEFAR